MKELKCLIIDNTLDQKCTHTITADNHDVLIQQMVEHTTDIHGISEVDREKLRSHVREIAN